MFFRREKTEQFTFESRLANLKQFGFSSVRQSADAARVTRGPIGAVIERGGENGGAGQVKIGKAGVIVGDEIGELVNRGYQMFIRTPSGVELPARAEQLKALHGFDEDLREGLGLTSLYNVALGTTTDEHLYDRVVGRDAGVHQAWEKSLEK
jgi:hypothetical protein